MSDAKRSYNEELAELLSAYLDGQLAPEETAKVEKRLVEDPEARTLLDQLRQVSQMVHSLPQSSAPADLAGEVMEQLERDALLGVSDTPAEMAGRTHLRFRRFAAAAAILVLAGAVVIIVYSVLFKEPIIVYEKPGDGITEVVPPDKSIIDPTQIPDYSQMHVVVNSFAPEIEADQLNALLEQCETENVIRQVVTSDITEFAFMCSTDTMQEIFRAFKSSLSINHIDLIVADKDKNDILRQFPDLLAPREPYLPNLQPLGPNEVILSVPLAPIPEPFESETPQKTAVNDESTNSVVEDSSLSLVAVRITIRLDEFRHPETIPVALDPNSLDGPVNLMLESVSEKLVPEPNVLNRP